MTTMTIARNSKQMTFDDLKGLRAEAYIRDSTMDQRDGFGPDIQRHNEARFAQSYGLILGNRWYTEFVSGRSANKRHEFQQVLEDARLDRFDVLLVDHTSRFGRNQAECIHYKDELQRLGKIVVFVSQGIISGSDRDFLSERINETLDEQYSRNLSRYVSAGLRLKHESGVANGVPPLGYKSEKLDTGKRERKVPDLNGRHGDPKAGGLEALLALLQGYASGQHSYQTLADHLNAQGYRNREAKPFTKGSVEHVLSNRFYEGKVVYHPDEPDEEVKEGAHEVPEEVRRLWLQCQQVKRKCAKPGQYSPKPESRIYPFTGILVCDICGKPYHGETAHLPSGLYRRMYHRLGSCDVQPRSINADALGSFFGQQVLGQLHLDDGWRTAILNALAQEGPRPDTNNELRCVESAIANLRKQHLWGAISDQEFKQEFQALDRERRILETKQQPVETPNLDRAAALLTQLPAL